MVNSYAKSAHQRTLTDIELCAWIGQAMPGEKLEYHRGFLSIDANPLCQAIDPANRRRIDGLARAAYRACDAGLIHLVQHRRGDGDFAYIAVTRPKPNPKPRRSRHDHAPPIGL